MLKTKKAKGQTIIHSPHKGEPDGRFAHCLFIIYTVSG